MENPKTHLGRCQRLAENKPKIKALSSGAGPPVWVSLKNRAPELVGLLNQPKMGLRSSLLFSSENNYKGSPLWQNSGRLPWLFCFGLHIRRLAVKSGTQRCTWHRIRGQRSRFFGKANLAVVANSGLSAGQTVNLPTKRLLLWVLSRRPPKLS